MMRRLFATLMLVTAVPAACFAQDSGPGPIAPAVSQQYDVTLYRRATTLDAAFVFTATGAANGTSTSGDFSTTINAEALTGTWLAHDLGAYAFWVAHAEGDTNSLTAIGLSTPDQMLGWASLGSRTGLRSFFPWLGGHVYFFYGAVPATASPGT